MSLVKIKYLQTIYISDSDHMCCLTIPNSLLYAWYSDRPSVLVQALNNHLSEDGLLVVRQYSATEDRLRRRASKVSNKVNKDYRRRKSVILEKSSEYRLSIDEIVKPHELRRQMEELNDTIDQLK